jgi:hypothetical protein
MGPRNFVVRFLIFTLRLFVFAAALPSFLVLASGCGDGGSREPLHSIASALEPQVTIASLGVVPTLIPSGTSAVGTASLSGPAPAGGATVTLTSGDPLRAAVPSTVTVPEGSTTATFAVTAQPVDFASGLAISASYGGQTRSAWVIVMEPLPSGRQLTSVTLASDVVVGGESVQGTVTLASADGGSTAVTLTSVDPSVATVPATVTVPAGAASASFTITTRPTSSSDFSEIVAEAGGVLRSAMLTTVAPPTGPQITSLVFFPASVGGGGPVTGRVTLSGPATDGAIVSLSSADAGIVTVPNSVVVIQNARSADFPVTTSAVNAPVDVTVSAVACCGGRGSATRVLTVTTDAPPPPDVVRVDSADFKRGGRGGTLTVRATSTSATAILTVFRDPSTVPTFVLTNKGGGRYEGSFSFSGTKPTTVTVRSNLGGSASRAVN